MVGRSVCRLIPCVAMLAMLYAAACQPGGGLTGGVTCYPQANGTQQCFNATGEQVTCDASGHCTVIASTGGTTTAGTTGGGQTTGGTGNPNLQNPNNNQPISFDGNCTCTPQGTVSDPNGDPDGDCLTNAIETLGGTSPTNADTDGDGVHDACEDINRNGIYEYGQETDPTNPDTDCDGLWDGSVGTHAPPARASVVSAIQARYAAGAVYATSANWSCFSYASGAASYTTPCTTNPNHVICFADGTKGGEDVNNNGILDIHETSPIHIDSDGDGIADGREDANLNGSVDGGSMTTTQPCTVAVNGESDPRNPDTDGDGIGDGVEVKIQSNYSGAYNPNPNGLLTETAPWAVDTDCDGLPDGVEDLNHNGILDNGETNPRSVDSDGDGLCDGKEDINHNGKWDKPSATSPGETSPLVYDSDGDGIPDGVENKDPNNISCAGPQGNYNPYSNPTVCWGGALGVMVGSDPRLADTDGDGIRDGVEDVNQDGNCAFAYIPNPVNPNQTILTFIETCAFQTDTDCDGLTDSTEDKNKNGVVDAGETNPRSKDSDYDGLQDGCVPQNSNTPYGCEDKNDNGFVDAGETDPTNPDSDGDLLSDACELNFAADPNYGGVSGPTNPLSIDTDGDGMADGDEDANHNCQTDGSETDPRHYDAPPQPNEPNSNYPQFAVCAASNLNAVTFAEDLRTYADVRIAFEEEQAPVSGATCPNNQDSECPSGEVCVAEQCTLQAPYIIQAFGQDNDGGGFNQQDQNDTLWGWTFQSPLGVNVDPTTNETLSRDIYGFVQLAEDSRALDDILDSVRDAFSVTFSQYSPTITQTGALPARPAFDTTAQSPVNFAQRQFSFAFPTPNTFSNISVRNDILLNQFFKGYAPSPMPPTIDPVYGTITCGGSNNPLCFANFTVYMTAVQRPNQMGPSGEPVVIVVLALTQNDTVADPTAAANRFYPDRLTRLQDLTGGSAVAHYNAGVGKNCDQRPQKQAQADLLWVVDDSRSMQQLISRLQQAAVAAQTILTSNSTIVNYRIGMTTTNASPTVGTLCPSFCDADCAGNTNTFAVGSGSPQSGQSWCTEYCADQAFGCIKPCAPSCVENSINPNGYTTCSSCSGSDVCAQCSANPNACSPTFSSNLLGCADPNNPSNLANAVANDGVLFNRWLTGGGGHFYAEDNWVWDCDTYTDALMGGTLFDQNYYIKQCIQAPYNVSPSISTFFGGTNTRDSNSMRGNAGMLGSDPNAVLGLEPNCTTTLLDLNATTANDAACAAGSPTCCGRLTNICDDGATVFASQMCDIIRAMGGLPEIATNGLKTSGARRHSAPEEGSRSARRLLQRMIPAYPYDLPASDPNYANAKKHLRMSCSHSDVNCPWPCDPTQNSNCQLVPLATVFLSDEEDFFFKDDCQPVQGTPPTGASYVGADKAQLYPLQCNWINGNPNNPGACTYAYCNTVANLTYGVPTGVGHDQAAWTTDAYYTLQWPSGTAPECGASSTSCVDDPCPLYTSATCGSAPAAAQCSVVGSKCVSHCGAIVEFAPNTPGNANTQRATCEADPLCYWDQSQVTNGPLATTAFVGACRMAVPFNDCQACKRFERMHETVYGTDANKVSTGLIGIGQVGPAYAVTRNKGQPGYGSWTGDTSLTQLQDTCGGGYITWGRGDGQAYRDIATQTLGRVQDICSTDYTDFVQLLVADLAILSKPYPLSESPIAATLKVGISRLTSTNPNIYTYIPVPRSQTSGFFYDATGNTIGFKSDPVDGQCGNGNCAADGNITAAEIIYAENANFVPQPGDSIYISYRTWEPVPCGGVCLPGETCAEVMCTANLVSTSCPSGNPNANAYCAPGYTCQAGACVQTCTTGQLVDACVNNPDCGPCQNFNSTTLQCQNMASSPNSTCVCNPNSNAIPCNPTGPNTCPITYTCDESCVCLEAITCPNVTYNADDTVSCPTLTASACGQAAVACCPESICPQHSTQTSCNGDSTNHCSWLGTSSNGVCEVGGGGCCNQGSSPSYFIDPELGTINIVCQPAACECCCEDLNAYPNGWGTQVPQCDPAAPGPGTMCSDNRPACGCYTNGG